MAESERGRLEEILAAAENAGDLPSPRGVASEVLRAVASERTTAQDLAKLIERDPAISARVMKSVNTPIAGTSREIGSVQQAVALLGFETIKSITVALSLLSDKPRESCTSFGYGRFWSESLARAVAMRHFASHVKAMPADEAFTGGLLSLIGRLALVSLFPKAYAKLLASLSGHGRDELAAAEKAAFRIGADELSALLMSDWGMPKLSAALGPDATESGIAMLLQLSSVVAELLVDSRMTRDQLTAMSRAANRLGINPDDLCTLFDIVAGEWRVAGRDMSIKTRCASKLLDMCAAIGDSPLRV